VIKQIRSGGVSAIVIGYYAAYSDGTKYLRIVGHPVAVNSIFATLSLKDYRGSGYKSPVTIGDKPDDEKVFLEEKAHYQSIRQNITVNGQEFVDLSIIHPLLTVGEDSTDRGFWLVDHQQNGVPTGFFERLNAVLPIPLKPEWANDLWRYGQYDYQYSFLKKDYRGHDDLKKESIRPVIDMKAEGMVDIYSIRTDAHAQDVWLTIVRSYILGSSLLFRRVDDQTWIDYTGHWRVIKVDDGLILSGFETLTAKDLDWLILLARVALDIDIVFQGAS
jgi:hypothetical protein